MAKINCKRVMLHNPMNLGGTNLTANLPAHRTGMGLVWDDQERMMYVTWNGETADMPETNIMYFIRGDQKIPEPVKLPVGKPIEAQVETPHSHVFAEMKGKTK